MFSKNLKAASPPGEAKASLIPPSPRRRRHKYSPRNAKPEPSKRQLPAPRPLRGEAKLWPLTKLPTWTAATVCHDVRKLQQWDPMMHRYHGSGARHFVLLGTSIRAALFIANAFSDQGPLSMLFDAVLQIAIENEQLDAKKPAVGSQRNFPVSPRNPLRPQLTARTKREKRRHRDSGGQPGLSQRATGTAGLQRGCWSPASALSVL